jgi:hypothetical protein
MNDKAARHQKKEDFFWPKVEWYMPCLEGRMWPNQANRTVYPTPFGFTAPPITEPTPLSEEVLARYELYTNGYKTLSEKRERLEDKSLALTNQLDSAESVKGNIWSRRDTGLLKRLTSESDVVKGELLAVQKALDSLISANETLVSLVSIHESCVKGYDEYISWKKSLLSERTSSERHALRAKL